MTNLLNPLGQSNIVVLTSIIKSRPGCTDAQIWIEYNHQVDAGCVAAPTTSISALQTELRSLVARGHIICVHLLTDTYCDINHYYPITCDIEVKFRKRTREVWRASGAGSAEKEISLNKRAK